jgi:hypothetical protein
MENTQCTWAKTEMNMPILVGILYGYQKREEKEKGRIREEKSKNN